MHHSKTFVLYRRPYLDTYNYNQSYKNIVTINVVPSGPLGKWVRRVQFLPLSEFKDSSSYCRGGSLCGLALSSFRGCGSLMCVDEVPDLFGFLMSHGYTIDTSLTKMMNTGDVRFHTDNANQIICFVTYVGS